MSDTLSDIYFLCTHTFLKIFGIYYKMETMKTGNEKVEYRTNEINQMEGITDNIKICNDVIDQLEMKLENWKQIKEDNEKELNKLSNKISNKT